MPKHTTGPNDSTNPGRPTFILGSASPARLRILRAAGVNPVVEVSDVDEDAVIAALPDHTPPAEVVRALAQAKAQAVAAIPWIAALEAKSTPVVVIGCDSMLHLDDRLLGKPHTAKRAMAQWHSMRGRHADLLTGHHLIRLDGGQPRQAGGTSSTTIHFADAADRVVERYVATGEPLAVAGAFTLDGIGGWLVERIEGDPSSVIGIGLPLVRTLIEQVGLSISDFWR